MAQANHRINIYLAPIDQVLSELELRFSGNDKKILCALGDICHSEATDRKSISRVAKNDGEILEAKQKMYASFCPSRGLGYMTVPEMLEKMHVNDLFHIFSVFSNVVHILGLIPDTLWSAE